MVFNKRRAQIPIPKIKHYEPPELRAEDKALFSEHAKLIVTLADQQGANETAQADQIKTLYHNFWLEHQSDIKGLQESPLMYDDDAGDHDIKSCFSLITDHFLTPEYKITRQGVALSFSVFELSCVPDEDKDTAVRTQELTEIATRVEQLFKPLLDAHDQLISNDQTRELHDKSEAIAQLKMQRERTLDKYFSKAVDSFISTEIDPLLAKEQPERVSQFKTFVLQLKQKPNPNWESFDCQEDPVLIDLLKTIKNIYNQYQKDLKVCFFYPAEEIDQLRASQHAIDTLFDKLYAITENLRQKLPTDELAFWSVDKACYDLQLILCDDPPDVEKAKKNLELLLAQMHTTDLYKPWHDCKGPSEMASYIMHALESAVRWLLKCVYICSDTSGTELTRENYFFKGPRKEVFDTFNKALSDLEAIEIKQENAPGMN